VLLLGNSLTAKAPQPSVSVNYNELFLKAEYVPPIGDFMELAEGKYPEYAKLLYCMCKYESNFNPYATGDHGLAIGWFQIHIVAHYMSYNCATDLECSMAYTVKQIKSGNGHLWSTYYKCLN
jgi:hypothetical protein